jgi:hypothetical protein
MGRNVSEVEAFVEGTFECNCFLSPSSSSAMVSLIHSFEHGHAEVYPGNPEPNCGTGVASRVSITQGVITYNPVAALLI